MTTGDKEKEEFTIARLRIAAKRMNCFEAKKQNKKTPPLLSKPNATGNQDAIKLGSRCTLRCIPSDAEKGGRIL